MRCYIAAAALVLIGASVEARAENWFKKHFNGLCADAVRNNAWPEPFIPADRISARAPFGIAIANGWRAQNTLCDYHFSPETGVLTEAGQLKVRSIVNSTPVAYRVVFVLRCDNAEQMAARMASVQDTAARFSPTDPVPVAQTNVEPGTTPAYYVVDIDRSFRESTPPPRLAIESGAEPGK